MLTQTLGAKVLPLLETVMEITGLLIMSHQELVINTYMRSALSTKIEDTRMVPVKISVDRKLLRVPNVQGQRRIFGKTGKGIRIA